jgi:uncharacterized protein YdaU (DUF1376 family)
MTMRDVNKFSWHARSHHDALDGMLKLSLEERGAYNTLLDLIYSRAGPVPDDDRWLAGWMGCSVKKWKSLRSALIAKGKVYETDERGEPSLMNARAAQEIANAESRASFAAENGAKGGRKSAITRGKIAEADLKPNENNGDGEAPLEGSVKLKTRTETEQEDTHIQGAGASDHLRQSLEASAAAGDALASPAVCPGIASIAMLRALLTVEPPCDWSEDVLPAVRSAAAWHRARDGPGSMRSWTTARKIALQNRNTRLAEAPAPKVIELSDARRSDPPSAKRTARDANHARALAGFEAAARMRSAD